jgi:hypothetical protein
MASLYAPTASLDAPMAYLDAPMASLDDPTASLDAPTAPLGEPKTEEHIFWKNRHTEVIAQTSIMGQSTYLGTNEVPTGKGLTRVYVYRVGDKVIALDCVVQCLWNVGTISNDDIITWCFSHIPENVEHHLKTMCESCDGLFKTGVIEASYAVWMR